MTEDHPTLAGDRREIPVRRSTLALLLTAAALVGAFAHSLVQSPTREEHAQRLTVRERRDTSVATVSLPARTLTARGAGVRSGEVGSGEGGSGEVGSGEVGSGEVGSGEVQRVRARSVVPRDASRSSGCSVSADGVAQRPESVRYRFDTTLRTSLADPFDTIHVEHRLPEDSFFVHIGLAARHTTLAIPYLARDSIVTLERLEHDARPWYETVLMVIVSVVCGVVMGRVMG